MFRWGRGGAVLMVLAGVLCGAVVAQLPDGGKELGVAIFKQLIEINTTDSVGSVSAAADAMAKRLRDAGFSAADVQVLGPNDRKRNMVARFHGTGRHKPILLIGHLDVVEAKREDWTTDPFQFIQKEGYYYGRGTQDMKDNDAAMVTAFILMKREGLKPDRDIILALTADEEGGKSNGVDWLVKNHRDLVNAEYVINPDAGGLYTSNGKPVNMQVEATEKLYADYEVVVTNPGGHSSLPVPDNAIYHLADALARLQSYSFPFELNGVTRAYYQKLSETSTGQQAADYKAILADPPSRNAIARLSRNPTDNSTMRTTCVATRLEGGHANNALPQRAMATVNCRILPGHSREEVRKELIRVFGDPKVTVRYVDNAGNVFDTAPDAIALPPVPLRPEVSAALDKVVAQMWPGTPIIANMETGASDSVYTNAAGMSSYGISGMAIDTKDERMHGRDERLPVGSFDRGVEFEYRFLKELTTAQ